MGKVGDGEKIEAKSEKIQKTNAFGNYRTIQHTLKKTQQLSKMCWRNESFHEKSNDSTFITLT